MVPLAQQGYFMVAPDRRGLDELRYAGTLDLLLLVVVMIESR